MATMLEEFTIEEQRSICVFCRENGLNAKDTHKEIFLFTVGSFCRVERSHLGWQTFR
jgi:hypothetical protein